jgi:hypothetical protein
VRITALISGCKTSWAFGVLLDSIQLKMLKKIIVPLAYPRPEILR